jgi:hypothetical protein
MRDERSAPQIVDRSTFEADVDAFRFEKAHTRGGDGLRPPADGFPWSRGGRPKSNRLTIHYGGAAAPAKRGDSEVTGRGVKLPDTTPGKKG